MLTVKNNGTAPLKYTLTGGLTGTHAADYNTAGALKLTILSAATGSGSGRGDLHGWDNVYGPTALTYVTTAAIIATRRGPLAGSGGNEVLCFQVTFDAAASTTLQGKTATATFTFTGTSDVS